MNISYSPHPDQLSSKRNNFLGLAGWVALSFSACVTSLFIRINDWYLHLQKPTWNPPAWVFAPVWTLLYLMMGVAAWLVWREGGWKKQRCPLTLFIVQWTLNALWTPLFFALHQPGLAFCEILLLALALATTIHAFWKADKWAATLLIPYLIWVSFAAFLNFTLWRLNEF